MNTDVSRNRTKPLFKYISSDWATKFFAKPTIRFTPPEELNDYFDCFPSIDSVIVFNKQEYIERIEGRKWTRNDIEGKQIIVDVFIKQNPGFSANYVKELIDFLELEYQLIRDTRVMSFGQYALYKIKNLDSNDESSIEDRIKIWKKTIDQMGYGILSLSELYNSPLMWAHYGKYHRGFVVELNIMSDFFALDPGLKVDKVSYSKERLRFSFPEISQGMIERSTNHKVTYIQQLYDMFHTKSDEWRYEKEWRLVIAKPSNYVKLEDCISDSGVPVRGLKELPTEAIKSIILGCRANSEHVKLALEFGKQNKTKIYQMKAGPTDFTIFRENIYNPD